MTTCRKSEELPPQHAYEAKHSRAEHGEGARPKQGQRAGFRNAAGACAVSAASTRSAGGGAEQGERFRGNGADATFRGQGTSGILVPVNRVAAGNAGILQVQPI